MYAGVDNIYIAVVILMTKTWEFSANTYIRIQNQSNPHSCLDLGFKK